MEGPAAPSVKHWEDCVDGGDMREMWADEDVAKEWIGVGESPSHRVLLSRDPDGNLFLTQTELMAVVGIIVHRHFTSQLDPEMICAIAEIESDRQPLAVEYDRKSKEFKIGIMQLTQTIAEWLSREMGYRSYNIEGNPALLYKPFVNLYYGAAYIKWLFSYDGKERTEEFVVRAYKGSTKKANHKSTLDYFKRYLLVRQSFPRRSFHVNYEQRSLLVVHVIKDPWIIPTRPPLRLYVSQPNRSRNTSASSLPTFNTPDACGATTASEGDEWVYWDSRVSPEDMEELWRHPDVLNEWAKSGERRGRVRFSIDKERKPYLSRIEVKAVAEIIISQHYNTNGVRAAALAALAEICSMRFVNGMGVRTGLMGIDYPTALWLYNDIGHKEYTVNSVDDLYNPFASMYFGAAYSIWLSGYEGRERTHQFIVQAYLGGPENVNLQETGPYWKKFLQTIEYYNNSKRDQGNCSIL